MTASETRWADLAPRVLSGVTLAAAGIAVVWAGGWVFALTACVACGVMVWEAARMFAVPQPLLSGIVAGAAIFLAYVLPWFFVLPVLLAAAYAASARAGRDKPLAFAVAVWIILAVFALVHLRENAGIAWIFWLVLVVVASDVAGYFAGRYLGGPKFWPRVSPKKTWSGTAAGWLGAVIIGAVFAVPTGAGWALLPVSLVVGLAGQMGDIAESAVKRRTGVKDSSNLIPGHGGVFDRFDALMGASAAVVLLWAMQILPVAG